MVKLKPGDRIDCRVKEAKIVGPYRSYDETRTFEIVAIDLHGYYLYIPSYINLKNTFKITNKECDDLNVDKRFCDQQIIYIKGNLVYRINTVFDGIKCAKCKEFYHMAAPNQPDGITMICWSCRDDIYR